MKKKLSLIVSLIAIMIISSVMPVDASSEIDDTEAIRFEINKQELSEGDTFTLQANIVDDSLDIDKLVVKYRLENTDDIKDLELVYNPDKELWELDLEINKDWQDGVWKLHKVKYSLSEDESYQKLEWQEHFTNGDFIVNKITEPTASTEEDTQNVQSNNSTVEPKNIEEVSLAAYNKIQTLSNSLYYETYYNKTLEEILDTQMTKGPQTDLYDGRWKNAKREDVEYYLNPENFLQFNSTIGSNENKIVEVTADILNVRERPSTTSTVITQVKKGSKYTVLAKSNDWYKINANGKTGWISGNYIIATSNIRYINSVQVMVDVLNVREKPTIESSRISQVKNGDVYIVLDESDGWCKINNNGKIGWISGNYVQLVNNVPRDMYQFLVLSGPSGVSADDLNNALRGKGILAGKGQAFIEAGKQHNVNELYLLSHAFLETGNGTSKLATGILVDKVDGKAVTPRVVYNMFGIGAADKDPLRLGAEYAYKEGWFTPEAAIIGGAKFISKSYINNPNYQQDTLYKMRWNPISPGSHQYATDIGWAVKQTRNIDIMVEIYAQSSSANLKFDIPKYGGYVEEVDEEEDNTPKISTIEVVADVLNVREKASTSSTRITQVKKGSKYTVLAESNGWYKISANGKTGWVYGEHVKEAKEEDNTPKISTIEVVA
ncbi:SH3 domain-containing protein, partial [Anaerosalibacter massiliensis]|uniref:SH3 domain-containing protein n=1 Tax=Anaerosalibacter massiliensis TaxID=1347392 RepID=UPI0011CB0603